MGDLELIAREFAPLVVLERKEESASIDALAKQFAEVADALKDVRESIDGKLQNKAHEDLKAVVEQDIDPEVYSSADYSATVSYGDSVVQVAYTYKGLGHDGKEANSSSYDVNWSAVEESKLRERIHEVHQTAKDDHQLGRVSEGTVFDPVLKNAKQEMGLRTSAVWTFVQYALLGRIEFL